MPLSPFHLAIPVQDIDQAVSFYAGVMGCRIGRSTSQWVDFNFFGHQLVCHQAPKTTESSNTVDRVTVPIPHFGIVLAMKEWEALVARLTEKGVAFTVEPQIRFKGEVGEQATFFFFDPFANALEFKAFADPQQLFAQPTATAEH